MISYLIIVQTLHRYRHQLKYHLKCYCKPKGQIIKKREWICLNMGNVTFSLKMLKIVYHMREDPWLPEIFT